MSKSFTSQIAEIFFYLSCAAPVAIALHSVHTTGHIQDWLGYVAVITIFGAYGNIGIIARFSIIEELVRDSRPRTLLQFLLLGGVFFNCVFVLNGVARMSGWLPAPGKKDMPGTTLIAVFGVIGTTIVSLHVFDTLASRIYQSYMRKAENELESQTRKPG